MLDSRSWEDIFSSVNIVIFFDVDVVIDKSIFKIFKDVRSVFFKCVVINVRGVDFYVMSFFLSGELIMYYYFKLFFN